MCVGVYSDACNVSLCVCLKIRLIRRRRRIRRLKKRVCASVQEEVKREHVCVCVLCAGEK